MRRRDFLKFFTISLAGISSEKGQRAKSKNHDPKITDDKVLSTLATIFLPAEVAKSINVEKARERLLNFLKGVPSYVKLALNVSVLIFNIYSIIKFKKLLKNLNLQERENLMASAISSRWSFIHYPAVMAKMMTGLSFYASQEGYRLAGYYFPCDVEVTKNGGIQEGAH